MERSFSGLALILLVGTFGVGFLTISGTLGGSLAGGLSWLSEPARRSGRETGTRLYVPAAILVLTGLAATVPAGIGLWGSKHHV